MQSLSAFRPEEHRIAARFDAESSANAEISAQLKRINHWRFKDMVDGITIAIYSHASWSKASRMTLKIEKHSDGRDTTIRLIGRMTGEHLAELEEQIRDSGPNVLLDLEDLNLVDVEAVRYLGGCEVHGIALMNCSAYIRDWITKERD